MRSPPSTTAALRAVPAPPEQAATPAEQCGSRATPPKKRLGAHGCRFPIRRSWVVRVCLGRNDNPDSQQLPSSRGLSGLSGLSRWKKPYTRKCCWGEWELVPTSRWRDAAACTAIFSFLPSHPGQRGQTPITSALSSVWVARAPRRMSGLASATPPSSTGLQARSPR